MHAKADFASRGRAGTPGGGFLPATANIFHVTADYLLKGVVELRDVQLSGTDAERIFIEDVFHAIHRYIEKK